jgi:hypothetical protein
LDRAAASNQRIGFDIEPCGRHLISGGVNGQAQVFDLADGLPCASIPVSSDTVNGVSIHPFAPLVAFSTGHRRFESPDSTDSDEEGATHVSEILPSDMNKIAIWNLRSGLYDTGEMAEPVDSAPELEAAEPAVKCYMRVSLFGQTRWMCCAAELQLKVSLSQ